MGARLNLAPFYCHFAATNLKRRDGSPFHKLTALKAQALSGQIDAAQGGA